MQEHDHGKMKEMPKLVRGERGASILASLVIVAILGGTALVADLSATDRASHLAATLAVDDTKCVEKTICTNLEGDAKDGAILEQKCEPGFEYLIVQSGEGGRYVSIKANPIRTCGKVSTLLLISQQAANILAKASESDTKTASCEKGTFSVPKNASNGTVQFCISAKVKSSESGNLNLEKRGCSPKAQSCDASESLVGDVVPKYVKDATKNLLDKLTASQVKEVLPQLRQSPLDVSNYIEGILNEKVQTLEKEIEKKQEAIDKIQALVDDCREKGGGQECEVGQNAAEKRQLEQERDDLKKQLADLNDAKETLADEAAKGPPGKGSEEILSDGTVIKRDGNGNITEICKDGVCNKVGEVPPGGSGPNTPDSGGNPYDDGRRPGSTFPPMGGQPPPGNQTPHPPGTCYGGQTICQGNTLYSRNNQCVDTPVQYCQYGCAQQSSGSSGFLGIFGGGTQSSRCAPPPQQGQSCPPPPVQPQQPCQNGTWRPTYGGANNTCVVGWQCVPNSGGDGTLPLTAEISCQPRVADVGMTLSISYSCLLGTSVGSGFQTGGAQAGSTTVIVSDPPGNTNVATYGLTCTDQDATASRQCSVQIGRPAIVLVANPKSVPSGTTSAIGWVTSGMQSCVISSPELSDFTEQHKNATNVNGAVVTPPLSSAATFVLKCATLGGSTRHATTTVTIQ